MLSLFNTRKVSGSSIWYVEYGMVKRGVTVKADEIASYAERRKENCSSLFSPSEFFDLQFNEKEYELLSSNIQTDCANALLLGMAYARFDKDLAAAIKAFDHGAALSQMYGPLLEVVEDEKSAIKIDTSHFFNPLFCALLSGRWQLSQQIAEWSGNPACVIKEPHDSGYIVRMLAALIQGKDEALPAILEGRSKHVGKPAPAYASYFDLMMKIPSKDSGVFEKELTRIDTEFHARAKSRANSSMGYGYGKVDGALNLDFMALGICKIASKRGIVINFDSDVIPKAVVSYWQR